MSVYVFDLWQEIMCISCCITDNTCRRINGAIANARRGIVLDPILVRMTHDPRCPAPKDPQHGYDPSEIMAWLNEDFANRAPSLNQSFIAIMKAIASDLEDSIRSAASATIDIVASSDEVMSSDFLRQVFRLPSMWIIRPLDRAIRDQRGMHIFLWPNVASELQELESLIPNPGN